MVALVAAMAHSGSEDSSGVLTGCLGGFTSVRSPMASRCSTPVTTRLACARRTCSLERMPTTCAIETRRGDTAGASARIVSTGMSSRPRTHGGCVAIVSARNATTGSRRHGERLTRATSDHLLCARNVAVNDHTKPEANARPVSNVSVGWLGSQRTCRLIVRRPRPLATPSGPG